MKISETELRCIDNPKTLISNAVKLAEHEAGKEIKFGHPNIYPTGLETSWEENGTKNVEFRFYTDHPLAQKTGPMIPVHDLKNTVHYVQGPTSPIEQKVYFRGTDAEIVTESFESVIGAPATTTLSIVQHMADKAVFDSWTRQRSYLNEYLGNWIDDSSTSATQDLYSFSLHRRNPYALDSEEDRKKRVRDKLKRNYIEPVRMQNHRGTMSVRANRGGANFSSVSPQEIVALQMLRSMVSKDAFRNYLRRGIVSVTGPSGLVYAIERKSHLVEVYRKGKLLSTLCVYLKDSKMPPTDEVVAKMVIVQCDEHDIWQRANINWKGVPPDMRISVNRHNFKEEHLVQLAVA